MNRDMERYKEFSRRALLVGAAQGAFFLVLAGRLGYLEVFEREKFQTLSDRNRISMRLLSASRGEIIDRFGVPLAINVQNFRVFIVPEQAQDVAGVLDLLAKIIPVTEEEKQDTLAEVKKNRHFMPILVKENISWDDMAHVEVRLPDLPGVSTDVGEMRSYPLGRATAHTIGYVGRVSAAEMTDDPVMMIPGFRIGKSGLEKAFDKDLRGAAGQVRSEVNVVGREVRELERIPPQKGSRLILTLDADLQMQCQEMVSREKSCSCVVMDAKDGTVYALCSHPSFDPNVFSAGIPVDMWEELLSDDAHPLVDKTIAGQYPPGSCFKIVTSLAMLESGVSPASTVFCPGYFMLGDTRFHCWKHSGHGNVDVVSALAQSCDTFFYSMGKRIGIDAIARMARRMGLGSRLGFAVPGEKSGLIPDKAWKKKHFGTVWHAGETLNCAIGQGRVLATPLQLATMTARLVNGGKAVSPVIVHSVGGVKPVPQECPDMKLSQEHLHIVRQGLYEVVNKPIGTAYGARIISPDASMAGKTGTAQVRRITAEMRATGYHNDSIPWKFRHHGLFVGYGPVDKPKYVVSVVAEHGGSSMVAAIIARDILALVQKRDPRRIRTPDDDTTGKGEPG